MFGGLWFLLASMAMPRGLQSPFAVVGSVVTIVLIATQWLRRNPGRSGAVLFRRRGYVIAVTLEIAAIYATSALMPRYGLEDYLIQAVGVIFGLHFIGLWQATRLSRFLWISGCMCCISILAAFLQKTSGGFNTRDIVTGLGNALVLWIGAGRTPAA